MKRSHFLICATLVLCLLPVLGTLAENTPEPRQIVQLHTDDTARHN
ncbi:MAG: hypothetical protein ACRBBU_05945 [Pseudooceanicola sp.]